jgi:CheY-like chemotaxis protein
MTVTLEPNPVVLIVEDEEQALKLRSDAFADADCTVVGVRSLGDAMRELRGESGVDLVLTDIHLEQAPGDKSGVELARYVRDTYALPVAGYSAVFADQELADDKDLFEAIWVKGSMDFRAFDEMVRSCRELALLSRRQRQPRNANLDRPRDPPLLTEAFAGDEAGLGARGAETWDTLETQVQAALILAALRPETDAVAHLARDVSRLESRVSSVARAVERLERQSIGRDRIAWAILGVLACVVGLLAATIGLIVGIEQLIGG